MKVATTPAQRGKDSDFPLSPQEEEIFFALIETQDASVKKPTIPIEMLTETLCEQQQEQHHDDAEDGDCEDDSEGAKARPRRSKRVATRRTTTRVTGQTATRRSSRIRR